MLEQLAASRAEWSVKREIGRVGAGSPPLIVGPWLSEVGYEILYWIPFLRWLKAKYRLSQDQIIVISRGGVASWYQDIGDTYVDIFDYMDPNEFAVKSEQRRNASDHSHKQIGLSQLDHDILGAVRGRLGLAQARVCHPSLMYRLFRPFWQGQRSLLFAESRLRFAHHRVPDVVDLAGLPDEYVAVKFYAATSLPDTHEIRSTLRSLVHRLAERTHVVLLDTGLALDDHQDYIFENSSRVLSAKEFMTPRNNLEVQTQIVGRARAFVGTCGGLAWLAPLLGIDTVAVFADARFLRTHLYLALPTYASLKAATFSPLDLRALDHLGLIIKGTERELKATGLPSSGSPRA